MAAFTTTNIDRTAKPAIMHTMMLASAADDNQAYGCGISDGDVIFKSGQNYVYADGLSWICQLDPSRPWLGHVRKPSSGTSAANSYASHPYAFENKGNPFIGAHNGWVAGTGGYYKNEPDTDSYRAFRALEKLVDGGNITRDSAQQWVHGFCTDSSYSFLMLQNGQLIGIRGHRTLFRAPIGNGYLYNTSHVVLETALQFARLWTEDIGDAQEIRQGTFIDSDGTLTSIDLTTQLAAHERTVTWRRRAARRT